VSVAVRPDAKQIPAVGLITEAHRIMTRLALDVMPNNEWNGRPEALTAFGPFLRLVLALSDSLDGRQDDWNDMTDNLFGKSAKDAAAAKLSAPTETTEESTEAEPETATA
jgi:hypothetical protein